MRTPPPVGGPRRKTDFDLPERSDADVRRAARILAALRKRYPDAHCELDANTPHELLVATILSAQATDVGVNKATPGLFAAFPTPADFAAASPDGLDSVATRLSPPRMCAPFVFHAATNLASASSSSSPKNAWSRSSSWKRGLIGVLATAVVMFALESAINKIDFEHICFPCC